MTRYVLVFLGTGGMPEADMAKIRAFPGIQIVNSGPNVLVVESQADIRRKVKKMPNWEADKEKEVIPNPSLDRLDSQ